MEYCYYSLYGGFSFIFLIFEGERYGREIRRYFYLEIDFYVFSNNLNFFKGKILGWKDSIFFLGIVWIKSVLGLILRVK